MWRALVFRPVLNKIGFDKLELVVSGGAPLPAETMAVWHMLGVNVVEMYGQTETAGGIIAGQRGPVPAAGRRRHDARGLRGEAGRRRRDPGALARPVRRLLGQPAKPPTPCSATTAGCAPATSANGATATSS